MRHALKTKLHAQARTLTLSHMKSRRKREINKSRQNKNEQRIENDRE